MPQGPVAAYPLPLDYFEELDEEAIRRLRPPEVGPQVMEQLETFSQAIRVGQEGENLLTVSRSLRMSGEAPSRCPRGLSS